MRLYSISFCLAVAASAAFAQKPVDLGSLAPSEQDRNARLLYTRVEINPTRDGWQLPDKVVAALAFQKTETVLTLGDDGYLSRRIAPLVKSIFVGGDKSNAITKANLEKDLNLQTLVFAIQDLVALASMAGKYDTLILYNQMSSMPNRQPFYFLASKILRAGGRLVIIDFYKNLPPGLPTAKQFTSAKASAELKTAGFTLSQTFDFLPAQFFLVAKN